jgi:hypothetical protein
MRLASLLLLTCALLAVLPATATALIDQTPAAQRDRLPQPFTDEARSVLTVGGSEHPALTDTMFGQRFFYDSHPPERTLALLAAAGFEPVVSEFMNLPTAGRDKGRYAVVARLR